MPAAYKPYGYACKRAERLAVDDHLSGKDLWRTHRKVRQICRDPLGGGSIGFFGSSLVVVHGDRP